MKTQLPKKSKAHEASIYAIRDVILESYKDKIAFIILFGSFARGDWIYDSYKEGTTTYEYASDYDFLIITKKHKQGSGQAATRLGSEISESLKSFRHPLKPHTPTIIIESVQRVNKELEKGQYFFSDIKKDGVLLYGSGEFELADARPLSKAEIKEIAEDYFEQWFYDGKDFLEVSQVAKERGMLKNSAFQLHQATENLLNCALLVLTDYKPKLHDLAKLLKLCASQSNKFLGIFPTATAEEETCFKLLQEAYIGARYDKNYAITKEQLEYLIARVEKLRDVVESVCKERIGG